MSALIISRTNEITQEINRLTTVAKAFFDKTICSLCMLMFANVTNRLHVLGHYHPRWPKTFGIVNFFIGFSQNDASDVVHIYLWPWRLTPNMT